MSTLAERITKRTHHNTVTGCIEYLGSASPNGYCNIRLPQQRKTALLHRVVWSLAHGPIPDTIDGKPAVIEHICCNKACVNIDHLHLTTQKENVNHPLTKARKKNASKRRGKNLSDDQLSEIYGYMDQGLTGYAISKITGRSESHISVIRKKYIAHKKHQLILECVQFMLAA